MNRVHRLYLLIVLTATIPALCGPAKADEVRSETYSFSPGKTLEIDLGGGGSVTVIGWDREEAHVTYSDTKRDLDDHKIRIQEKRGGLRITSKMIRERNVTLNLEFEIRVPHECDVEFDSMGGGIELVDLKGTFKGKTMGGQFLLRNLKGEARMKTMGGGMEVFDCHLDGKLSTGGGPVLLENVVGDLDATSGGGNVRYDNVRDKAGRLRTPDGLSAEGITHKTVVISTAGGPVQISEAPEGARLRTGGGDIEVFDASRFVEVWTGGGDINIRIEEGWVEAFTGAGDVDITIEEDLGDGDEGIEIFTGTGDVTVTLPEGLSLDLDLQIGYTRNSSRKYDIKSDIPINLERTDDWDYGWGSPKKYILGTASILGGEHHVTIRTTNGNIRIETD